MRCMTGRSGADNAGTGKESRNELFGSLTKQIANGNAKQVAQLIKVFKADPRGFIINDFVKVLVAHIHLLIEPIFCMILFFQYFQYSQAYHAVLLLGCCLPCAWQGMLSLKL